MNASTTPLINFVLEEVEEWADVAAPSGAGLDMDELAPRIRMGREIWVVQAFHMLRRRGWNVRLSGELKPDAVNVLHCDDVQPRRDLWRYFLVTIRADRDPAFISQAEIVQNRASVWQSSDLYVPHWPQPGLLARDPGRGTTVENVVYMGKPANLDAALRSNSFREALSRLGMKLVVRSDAWWDYSTADVVLAVRNGPAFSDSLKPASKLINAWHAGCPAVLGPEVGYRELRTRATDYLEAQSPDEVLSALEALKQRPSLFRAMVARGRQRAGEFTRETVTDRWVSVLRQEVVPMFLRWDEKRTRHPVALQMAYVWNRIRRRLWGTRAVETPDPAWKEPLNLLRRGLVLPSSLLPPSDRGR